MTSETRVQHTPGPWRMVYNWRDKIAVVGPRGDRIGNMPRRRDGQGDANARLIAAAPDLLAALDFAYDLLVDNEADATDLAYVMAAIRRARGED